MNLNLFDPKNIRTVTDLRHDPDKVLTFAGKADAPVIVFERSTPRGAIISLDLLNEFQEKFEDLQDSIELCQAIAETKKEDLLEWDKVKGKLRRD